jgi:hypothetical protein
MNERPKQPQVACAAAGGLVMAVLSLFAVLYVCGVLFLTKNEPPSAGVVTALAVAACVLAPLYALAFLHLLPLMSCPDCTQPLPRTRPQLRSLEWVHGIVCPRCGCLVDLLGRKTGA